MQQASPGRTVETAPLLALAAALIVNSHLEDFYPLRFLAADGLLGNSLFFFMSGFGRQASRARGHSGFWSYCRRGAGRIYPPLVVCVAVFAVAIGDSWRYWSIGDLIAQMVWPSAFTYIRCIVPFYLVFYLILQVRWPLVIRC